jgi:hypothetical protein
MEDYDGAALLIFRVDVKVRGGGPKYLHTSCRHLLAVADVERGELRHAAHGSHPLVRHLLADADVE